MQLLDGKKTAEIIKKELKKEVDEIIKKGGKRPHLATILVGNNGGSEIYVRNKIHACKVCGFDSTLIRYDENVSEEELLKCIDNLNHDSDVDGFIVQLPLPSHISQQRIIESIDYRKDVDGFHPINVGRLFLGMPCFISATPKGILELLKRNNIQTKGKKCVIIGRSNIVGKPLSVLMMQKQYGDSTVVVCHSHSKNLKKECCDADILIAAVGKPEFITKEYVSENTVVIDVGTTRVIDNADLNTIRLKGDVKFNEVSEICDYITPVPGGVGPMTIAMLMQNTMDAFKGVYYKNITERN